MIKFFKHFRKNVLMENKIVCYSTQCHLELYKVQNILNTLYKRELSKHDDLIGLINSELEHSQ